jgi:hypothetical protein
MFLGKKVLTRRVTLLEERPGSWNVLIVAMAASFAAAKWLAQRCNPCLGSAMLLTGFLTRRYATEINLFFKRVRRFFCGLAFRLWWILSEKEDRESGLAMA